MTPAGDIQSAVSEAEWQVRVDLAACYRAIAMFGWDDLVFTHITARVPGGDEHFLINPYGMLFEEVTASSLVKIDLDGAKVLDTPYDVNPAGFTIHSAVHAARDDAGCVLHTHTRAGVAVSIQPQGLRPLSQIALLPYAQIRYHDYEGIALLEAEKARLVADLGDSNALILRNHGLLTVGPTVADAFLMMYALETACQVQVMAESSGRELLEVPAPIVAGIRQQVEAVTRGMGGAIAWPAILRKLDRLDPSFRD